MKLCKFMGAGFSALFLGAIAFAETPQSALPSGPLIAKEAPNFAQWTVTTKFKSAAPATVANPAPGGAAAPATPNGETTGEVIKVVKTGNIYHISQTRQNGTKLETWCVGEMQVTTRPEWPQPVLSTGERKEDAGRIDLSHGDFSGFEWISAKNFVGIRKSVQGDCMMFQQDLASGAPSGMGAYVKVTNAPAGTKQPMIPVVAMIDLKTRLPVSLQSGDETTTYAFDNPPTSKQSLPPDLQTVIDNWIALKKRLTHVAVHP